ncbi:uncharacterized protein LOC143227220 [Tachypleus tridentatus]|uniref:uncharacterized protein LOC143227220 n=1 Tax=Tachypleus tridentatus TaxID=6853 RepID=UPI003FCFA9D2
MYFRQQIIYAIILTLFGLFDNTATSQETGDISLDFYRNNGLLKLIIRAYTEDLIRDFQQQATSHLSSLQMALLKERLTGLYDYVVEHPALHEHRLWVGNRKPNFIPNRSFHGYNKNEFSQSEKKNLINQQFKRSSTYPSEETCGTETTWLQINLTTDVYNKPVEVIQQEDLGQYIFSFRCLTAHSPCRGISPLYESECIERLGWMYMYYRRRGIPNEGPQWGPVAVPHHCTCKITPKFFPNF